MSSLSHSLSLSLSHCLVFGMEGREEGRKCMLLGGASSKRNCNMNLTRNWRVAVTSSERERGNNTSIKMRQYSI